MITIFFRTIIVYFFLVLAMRLTGKRQIGELQISEFIVSMILSEVASAPLTNRSMPLSHAVVPILSLLSLEVILSFVLLKSNRLKRLFYGSPSVIINKGKLVQTEMKRNRLEVDELMSTLRQQGIADPSDVYYAVLEENGKLSVFPTAEKTPITPQVLEHAVRESGIAHVCVIDGHIIENSLSLAGIERVWLLNEIAKQDARLKDVFLMTVDDCGKVNIVKRDRRLSEPPRATKKRKQERKTK